MIYPQTNHSAWEEDLGAERNLDMQCERYERLSKQYGESWKYYNIRRERERETERVDRRRLERYIGHGLGSGAVNGFLVIGWATERNQAKRNQTVDPQGAPQSSIVDNSNTLKWDKSLENSDHPVTSRQLYWLASFSPAVMKFPISSSETLRKRKNSRVKTH